MSNDKKRLKNRINEIKRRMKETTEDSLTNEEMQEYVALKQYSHIRTIKSCLVFLTVLAALPLVCVLLYCLWMLTVLLIAISLFICAFLLVLLAPVLASV